LSWFGIVGAVITLTTNLQSVLILARWARQFLAGWTSAITYVWHHALFFLPQVHTSDAVILTAATFAIVNMIPSLARHADETPRTIVIRTMRVGSILVASAILSLVFYLGFFKGVTDELRTGGSDFVDAGYFVNGWVKASFAFKDRVNETIGTGTIQTAIFAFAMFGSLIAIPLLPAVVICRLLRTMTSVRLSSAALSARLWRVVAGLCLVVALNFLSLWIEQQPWALSWLR
jgi:hypothetical protein